MEKVYLYIANIEKIDVEAVLPKLSAERQARVTRCVDIQTKRQRAASELVCAYALRDLGEEVALPLRLLQDENGKPYLEESKWNFNISHSGNIVCCAVSETVNVGADVQQMEARDFEKLAKQFCSENEYARLLRYGEEKLSTFFYEFWARKEAIAKRDGVKKYASFRDIDVTWWHVCCFSREDYMYAVAADKAFELIVRMLPEKWL